MELKYLHYHVLWSVWEQNRLYGFEGHAQSIGYSIFWAFQPYSNMIYKAPAFPNSSSIPSFNERHAQLAQVMHVSSTFYLHGPNEPLTEFRTTDAFNVRAIVSVQRWLVEELAYCIQHMQHMLNFTQSTQSSAESITHSQVITDILPILCLVVGRRKYLLNGVRCGLALVLLLPP